MIVKHFHTIVLENEDLDYIELPENYNYNEIFGHTHIRYNEFIPVLTLVGFSEPAIYGYRNMRCYQDNTINYIADWWKEKNKPCDEPFSLPMNDYIIENNIISIFPNPAQDKLNIQFAENFNTEQITITVYDIMGKIIFEKEYLSEPLISVDIQNLIVGCYFVKISNKNNIVLIHKFIKL